MAMACKCDRCKRFFNINNNGMVDRFHIYLGSLTGSMRSNGNYYDLCSSCAEDLSKWINLIKIDEDDDLWEG